MPGESELSLLSAIETPLALLSGEARILFANRSFSDLLDEQPSVPELKGAYLEEFVRDLTPLNEAIHLSRSVSGGIPFRLVFRSSGNACRFSLTSLGQGAEAQFLLQGMQRRTDHFLRLNNEFHKLNEALSREAVASRRYKAINRGIEQFIEKLVHDIRSPVSSVFSVIGLASEDLKNDEYKSLAGMLELSREQVNRLLGFVDRLYRDLKQEQPVLVFEEVILDSLVDELKRDLSAAIEEVGAQVEFCGERFPIRADRVLLRQLLQNLVQNSIKFRRNDRLLRVVVRAERDSEFGDTIRVEDNGRGFETKQAEALFERFYRVDPSGGEGFGLGLATCRQIAELHGWEISAAGRPNQGATFKLSLR